MDKINVNLLNHPHDILLGFNTLKDAGVYLKRLKIGDSVFIITSPRIGRLYENILIKSLNKAGLNDIAVYHLPDGERYKNTTQWQKTIGKIALFDNSENKKLFIVNLGGGVVGDLGGFVAASYHRGINYVQIPTTLLAFVDCGVGGKVGVNFGKFKNSVGAFWHPKLVFADISVLSTLSKRQFKSGLAEVIKYGVSLDSSLLSYLEKNYKDILSLDFKKLLKISKICYEIKARIVERDHRDNKNIRVVLNFGHTVGHAVESASKYSYTHGESISIGMACANDIAVEINLLEKSTAYRIEEILNKMKLPTKIKNCNLSDILDSMKNDKKFIHSKNRFVLLTDIGKTRICEDVPARIIKKVIKSRLILK